GDRAERSHCIAAHDSRQDARDEAKPLPHGWSHARQPLHQHRPVANHRTHLSSSIATSDTHRRPSPWADADIGPRLTTGTSSAAVGIRVYWNRALIVSIQLRGSP